MLLGQKTFLVSRLMIFPNIEYKSSIVKGIEEKEGKKCPSHNVKAFRQDQSEAREKSTLKFKEMGESLGHWGQRQESI